MVALPHILIKIGSKLRRLREDARGTTALTFAIASPLFLMAAAYAVDMGYIYAMRSKLQVTVDSVALEMVSRGSITEIVASSLTQVDTLRDAETEALDIARRNLPAEQSENAVLSSDITVGEWDPVEQKFIDTPPFRIVNAVRVKGEISKDRGNPAPSFFRGIFNTSVPIRTKTVAVIPPVPAIHTLDPSRSGSFTIIGTADLDTHDIWTNSTARDSVKVDVRGTRFGAIKTFTAGGSSHSNRIETGMYPLEDLLAEAPSPNILRCSDVRSIDPVQPCNMFRNRVINEIGTVIIRPGVYQGGLVIEAASKVQMMPGVYIFKDGPLVMRPSSFLGTRVEGENVMLYFTGSGAKLDVEGGSLALKGLETGPYRGYVMFSDRDTTSGETHNIASAMDVLGTIYSPTNDFIFDKRLDAACHSLCLVAANITIRSGSFDITSLQSIGTFGNGGDFPAPAALRSSIVPFLRAFEYKEVETAFVR